MNLSIASRRLFFNTKAFNRICFQFFNRLCGKKLLLTHCVKILVLKNISAKNAVPSYLDLIEYQ